MRPIPNPVRLVRPALGLALAGALTLAAAPLAAAAESCTAQEPAARAQRRDDDSRAVRRILHLRDGTTVRATSRRTADGWELKRSGKWRPLPDGAVERAVLERRVEADHATRARLAKREGLDARADVAAWAFENGLLEEALRGIQKILEEDPDHAPARDALTAHAHLFVVPKVDTEDPESLEDLSRWAGQRARASQELAVLELARQRDRETLREALEANLFARTMGRRRFGALGLRRLFPGQALEPLLHRAVLDPAEEVREDAALALRTAEIPALIVPVARALESDHYLVRTYAAQALGNMGYPAAVAPLAARLSAQSGGHNVPHAYIFTGNQKAYIQDFDVQVAQFQAVADPQVNILIQGNVLEAGVHSVMDAQFATKGRAIRAALGKLTGAEPGRSNGAWLRWWEENAARYADEGAR